MSNEIAKLEAAIEIATKRLAELKAAEAAQTEKAWPQKGDTYFTIGEDGEAFEVNCWLSDAYDLARKAIGNIFRTESEAQKEIERRKVLTELRRLARESWGDDKADWSNSLQRKWSLFLNHGEHRWRADAWRSGQLANAVYFATEQAALTAIETIGAERLMMLLED